ncbi:MAG: DUF5684 domain-containing protein [Halobacteriales archaeon]
MTVLEAPNTALQQGITGFSRLVSIAAVAIGAAVLAGVWKTFRKANYPGWAAVVPIYNVYVMLEIGDEEWWWVLVLFVPVLNIYAAYRAVAGVSEAFDRGTGFALGLLVAGFVFWPLLGFGGYSYQGSPEDVLDERLEDALDKSDEDVI